MDNPLVSIIIVNWNGKKYLVRCLSTAISQAYLNKEIIVVDNGSADGSIDFIKEKYANAAKLIANSGNLGFAQGNNIGILQSRGGYILTLNNDAELDENCLSELVKAIESDERIGMCAPKILLKSNHNKIDSVGHLIYQDGLSRQRGRLEADLGQYDKREEVVFPSACCGLYRRKMLDEIGLFDSNFFMFVEDTDLGLRARLAGWKCIYVPEAVVYHNYSSSAGGYSALKAFFIERNRIWLVIKLFPLSLILSSFYYTLKRYLYQFYGVISKRGSAAYFAKQNSRFDIIGVICKSYIAACLGLPVMLKQRRRIRLQRKVSISDIHSWFSKFGISAEELALKE